MIYIGIDPDLENSGFAVWSSEGKTLSVSKKPFFEVIDRLKFEKAAVLQYAIHSFLVVIEAGWLNKKSNFHEHSNGNSRIRERIAKNVGENHAVGKLFEKFCRENNINYILIKPTTHKWDAATFKKITGLTQRTNSEERDAAKLVYGR
jgi:hypothetical protein